MPLLQNIKKFFESKNDASSNSSHESAHSVDFTVSSQSSYEQVHISNIPKSDKSPKSSRNDSNFSPYPGLPSRYTLQQVLGEGAFSVVYKAIDQENNETVAIKIINKSELTPKQLQNVKNEISIMRKIRHPNVLQLIRAHDSAQYSFLVLEYADGGEIFNKIIEYTYFSEDLSRHVFIQLLRSIEYLHSRNIVHRDIKPENLLFKSIPYMPRSESEFKAKMRKSDDETKVDEGEFVKGKGGGTVGVIKLADFGLAKQLKSESMHKNLKTPCGTAGYTAPEVITCDDKRQQKILRKNYYSKSVDIWSLGCFLYTILCGFPPFYDDNPEQLTIKILQGDFVFLRPWWDEISKESKDLINKMLVIDPEERITIDQIWKHPWVTQSSSTKEEIGATTEVESSEVPSASFQFPDNYFSSTNKHSVEHIENANYSEEQVESSNNTLSSSHLAPMGSNSALADGLMSPRASAIKMVFNNPVLHTKSIPNQKGPVKFTDEAFKNGFSSSSSDEEGYPRTPNPPVLNFKDVFSGINESIEEIEQEADRETIEDDDVKSLVDRTNKAFNIGISNESNESLNSMEFDRETRSSSIISGIGGDFKFTLNMNNSSLIGRRKSQKGSVSAGSVGSPSSEQISSLGGH